MRNTKFYNDFPAIVNILLLDQRNDINHANGEEKAESAN